jgi:hypothetical protein
MTISRAFGIPAGFPQDGSLVTFRSSDEIVVQYNYPYKNGELDAFSWRIGRSKDQGGGEIIGFGAWHYIGNEVTLYDLTAINGWVAYAALTTLRAVKVHTKVTIGGTLKNGTITQGTTITTLPAGLRPYHQKWFTVPCGANFDTLAVLSVLATGEIQIQSVTNNAGLTFDGITFDVY